METRRPRLDYGIALGLGLIGLILYVRTAAPSVVALFDDSLEFQLVLPTLGIAHPTGYPLYTLLGYAFTRLPLGEVAYRVNLFSAAAAAAAVGMLYLAGRVLTGRRLAAALAAAYTIAIPVWWSQATVAEVYALHGFLQALLCWTALRWSHGTGKLWPVGLVLGLGLTHHRMIVLLAPAVAIWLAARLGDIVRKRREWVSAVVAFLLPLSLYAYLPIRGRVTTSLDGTYRNDWAGFWAWVTARGYNVFLTGNPFQIDRDVRFYLDLLREQVGYGAVALAAVGVIGLLLGWIGAGRRRARWDGAGLAAALLATYGFGLAYRAADIEVFFIPAFLTTALALAAGLAVIQEGWEALCHRLARASAIRPLGHVALGGVVLMAVVWGAADRLPQMDRHARWEVHDLGVDMLSQPLPKGAAIVGILGETTLIRYVQFAHGLRPDVLPVPADREADRFIAVDRLLREGRPVFLTRRLPGAEQRYSLGAVGPLIRVWPKGEGRWDPLPGRIDQSLGAGVRLRGYLVESKALRSGRLVRLTLHWRAEKPIAEPLKISARLATPADDKVAMRDDEPVHEAYPTTAWIPGEIVQDVYDIRVPPSVPAGRYEVLVILYRAADGTEIGRATLGPIELPSP
ncbi:MAG: DUF2723 domain-containing protein [Chloroflexi bacterium]|nr:DUF2723 domain-containing protein [Chloroflexota bacterium]